MTAVLMVSDFTIAPLSAAVPIDVGQRRQLFVDRKFIHKSSNVALNVHPVVKAEPVDLGIETTDMVSVVEYQGRFYMYVRVKPFNRGFAVATSTDSLHWTVAKPPAFGEGRQLPLPGVDSGSVFLDPNDGAYPFKGVFSIRNTEPWGLDPEQYGDVQGTTEAKTRTTARGGLFLFRSGDGLQWECVPGLAAPLCDTQNQVFFDVRLDRYVAYLPIFSMLGGPQHFKRSVARTEMTDLYKVPWPYRPNSRNKPSKKTRLSLHP